MTLYSLSPFLPDRLKAALHESICFGCIICWFTFNYTEILMVLCQQFWCSGDLNVSVGHIKNKLLIHMRNGENLPLIRDLTQIVLNSCLNFRWVFFLHIQEHRTKIWIISMNLKEYSCNIPFLMRQNLWIIHIVSQTCQNKNPLTLWQRKK